jgi:hypothetical protein
MLLMTFLTLPRQRKIKSDRFSSGRSYYGWFAEAYLSKRVILSEKTRSIVCG